jgi:Ni/Co efflux regulator RcnB
VSCDTNLLEISEVKLILTLAIQKKTKALLAREEEDDDEEDIPRSKNHQEEDEDEEDDNPQPTKHARSNRPSIDMEESAYTQQFQGSSIPGAINNCDSDKEDHFGRGEDLDEDKQYNHDNVLLPMEEEDNVVTNTFGEGEWNGVHCLPNT